MEKFFSCERTVEERRASPLGAHLDAVAQHFADAGYSRFQGRYQVRLAAEFGQWLWQKRFPLDEMDWRRRDAFLRDRAKRRTTLGRGSTFFDVLCAIYRRKGLTVVEPVADKTPVDRLVEGFDLYLRQERRLGARTAARYAILVRDWLRERAGRGPVTLSKLTSADVVTAIQRRAQTQARKTVKLFMSALRSFFRYARYRGYIRRVLEDGMPPLADWSKRAVPRTISRQQIQRLLTHCDRRRAIGRRDYAILLLFARLGLRACEVTSLTLDDIDWNVGCLQVQGKGSAGELPLPPDVGRAIATYLRRGRPRSRCRRVFLRHRAPAIGFKTSAAVDTVVARAFKRAGIASPSKGSHQFRHALASELLRRGASLGEIGDLLRHRNIQTTTIYAKVDLPALKTLAQPWFGGRP